MVKMTQWWSTHSCARLPAKKMRFSIKLSSSNCCTSEKNNIFLTFERREREIVGSIEKLHRCAVKFLRILAPWQRRCCCSSNVNDIEGVRSRVKSATMSFPSRYIIEQSLILTSRALSYTTHKWMYIMKNGWGLQHEIGSQWLNFEECVMARVISGFSLEINNANIGCNNCVSEKEEGRESEHDESE